MYFLPLTQEEVDGGSDGVHVVAGEGGGEIDGVVSGTDGDVVCATCIAFDSVSVSASAAAASISERIGGDKIN